VINFDATTSARVGRAQNVEVRINDISVSRHHSTFSLLEDGTIALTDNNSKFGTHTLIRQPIEIPLLKSGYNETVYLQIGRAVLALQSRRIGNKNCLDCLKSCLRLKNI